MKPKNRGWFNDRYEHALAGAGYKPRNKTKQKINPEVALQKTPARGKDKEDEKNDDRFWLDKEAKIYIPSTDDTDKEISDKRFEQRIKNAQEEFSEKFGGTTTFLGKGTYISDAGDFVKEDVAVMQVNMTEESWNKQKNNIYEWLEKKQEKWGQESVSFEFEGDLTFIEEDD